MRKALTGRKHAHFIGIGGIGMSALARALIEKGIRVSGSDIAGSDIIEALKRLGAEVHIGHKAANVAMSVDLLVYSSCIRRDNPEMEAASRRGISIISRGALLAEIMSCAFGIAVCGAHGKTTTSAMTAVILHEAGLDPTAFIGGEVNAFGSNARIGKGRYLVAEADESDGSFLKLKPLYSVITNIDEDHLDHFKTPQALMSDFKRYALNTRKDGCIIFCEDDKRLSKIVKQAKRRSVGYGLGKDCGIRAADISLSKDESGFDCYKDGKKIGRFRLVVPGLHNVLNSLGAIAVGLKLGIEPEVLKSALFGYTGTKRRFQINGCLGGVTVVEDYAHHPTEITATVNAARLFNPKRIIAVFQPHRYTRTLHLMERFFKCFCGVNRLILTDIYGASESPIKGVNIQALCDGISELGNKDVQVLKKEKIADYLCGIKRPGDMILILGAGDINKVAEELAIRLNSKFQIPNAK